MAWKNTSPVFHAMEHRAAMPSASGDGSKTKKDAAQPRRPESAGRFYFASALTRAAALSVCSQVKNLKFLSPALRPKWPYWSVRE